MVEKKIIAVSVTFLVLTVIGIFIGGYFCGINSFSRNHKSLDEASPFTEKLTDSQTTWQQRSCYPRRNKCPKDFQEKPPLLLISLDGFRPDQLLKIATLKRLAECGVRAQYMRPVYPTKTLTNHYTIVTGLYPESHGIIGNTIYNRDTNRKFSLRNRQDNYNPEWWKAEPIWVTAEKQGRKAASYFWPGSDIEIKGKRPSYYFRYKNKVSWNTRVNTVLSWLDLPYDSRPSLITFYFNEPDHTSHQYGPFSQQMEAVFEKIDILFRQLMEGLQARELVNCVDIIIVGDHGMSNVDCDKVILLKDYVNATDVYFIAGTVGRIQPKHETEDSIQNLIEKFRCDRPELMVYHKNELPRRYHYSANKKIEPIIIDLLPKWTIAKTIDRNYCGGGAHGYDNLDHNMNTIFVAYGPSFKRNLVVKPFLNVELYELMSELLKITPEPNNGTYGSLHHILRNPQQLPNMPSPKVFTICVISNRQNKNRNLSGCSCKAENLSTDGIYLPTDTRKNYDALMPWGAPALRGVDSFAVCHLVNSDHVTAFHKELKLPIWTSFIITKKNSLFSGTSKFTSSKCWLADGRVPAENLANCTQYSKLAKEYPGLQQRPLFPLAFASSETSELSTHLMTNAVPMYHDFQSGVWLQFLILLSKWSQKYGLLNVVMGPVFDINSNGIRPHINDLIKHDKIPVPTHYFAIVTYCHTTNIPMNSCRSADLEMLSFLIPHRSYPDNCQTSNEYFLKHSAKVKDVEIITGLEFFTQMPSFTAIELRTRLVEKLWNV